MPWGGMTEVNQRAELISHSSWLAVHFSIASPETALEPWTFQTVLWLHVHRPGATGHPSEKGPWRGWTLGSAPLSLERRLRGTRSTGALTWRQDQLSSSRLPSPGYSTALTMADRAVMTTLCFKPYSAGQRRKLFPSPVRWERKQRDRAEGAEGAGSCLCSGTCAHHSQGRHGGG